MGKQHHILFALAATAAALTAAPAAAQSAPDTLFRYRVQPGDTLSAMARDYFVNGDYRTVQTLNRVADPRRLPINSILLVPTRLLRIGPIDSGWPSWNTSM